ncbi:hypothetical protein [Streptomyces sp. TRM64462]|uniref:hypothetical protein n=1 Tax=Streptomyces sp. TRM64462 TaxID=2741726 RepID=UPI0015868291|nr:hypothetical protein [Streptomyces sp. TRM64462]
MLAWFGINVVVGGSGSPFPAATHRLELPGTLLDSRYTLADDHSDTTNRSLKGTSETNIRDAKAVAGQYTAADEARPGVLIVSGLYGRIKNPATARTKTLKGAADAPGTQVLMTPRNITPPGSTITVSCQALSTSQARGGHAVYAMCAWADDNTSASVAEITAQTATTSLDLASAARTTLAVREEMRRPIK